MNVFITGGAGFIGSYLAEHHLRKNDNVCVLDNLSHGCLDNISGILEKPNFQFIEADLLTYPNLEDCVERADRIYHLASAVGIFYLIQNPLNTMRTNILGCERLLHCIDMTQSKARVLIASSSEVYGPNGHCPLQENAPLLFEPTSHGKWFYASSKYTAEMLSLAYVKAKGLAITIVRLFNTTGPRQNPRYGSVVPRFIEAAFCGAPITIFGTGEQTRCFSDVHDMVIALDLVLCNPLSVGEIINIGQDHMITINALATMIKTLVESPSPLVHVPYEEAYGENYEDILYRQPELTKYFQFVSYKFQWDLQRSLKHQIALIKSKI